jgi:CcmD family protein
MVSELIYLYLSYTVIMIGLFVYIIYLHKMQVKLTRDIEILERGLEHEKTKADKKK